MKEMTINQYIDEEYYKKYKFCKDEHLNGTLYECKHKKSHPKPNIFNKECEHQYRYANRTYCELQFQIQQQIKEYKNR